MQKSQDLLDKNLNERTVLDGDGTEAVNRFSYLRVVSIEGGVQETVTTRTGFAWTKFKSVSIISCKIGMSLRIIGTLYKSCEQRVMVLNVG